MKLSLAVMVCGAVLLSMQTLAAAMPAGKSIWQSITDAGLRHHNIILGKNKDNNQRPPTSGSGNPEQTSHPRSGQSSYFDHHSPFYDPPPPDYQHNYPPPDYQPYYPYSGQSPAHHHNSQSYYSTFDYHQSHPPTMAQFASRPSVQRQRPNPVRPTQTVHPGTLVAPSETATEINANIEIHKVRSNYEKELATTKAKLSRAEIQISSLEKLVEMKTAENLELSQICEHLLQRIEQFRNK